MRLLRFSLLLTLVFVSGCYPIEKVYERTKIDSLGGSTFETISKIKIEQDSKTGACVRFIDSPATRYDTKSQMYVQTKERERATAIVELKSCVIIDESNWQCMFDGRYPLEMVGGELRWRDDDKAPFKATYKLAF
jgi:hypothetical protein